MLAAGFLMIAMATPEPEPTLSPYQIYKTAITHLASLNQPRFIDQTDRWQEVRVAGADVAGSRSWSERRIWDSANRLECVLSVPFNPSLPVIVGDAAFSPDAWLVKLGEHRAPPERGIVPNIEPDLSDLKTIGIVSTVSKPFYNVRLVGIDPLASGGNAWHLRLDATSDPMKHNIRELWINAQTYDIMTAVLEGTYRPNPSAMRSHTYVQEDFGQVGSYWLMIHSIWTYVRPGFESGRSQYEATALEMRFPEDIPSWFFDEAQFRAHLKEVPAALEWPIVQPSPDASPAASPR
jgi:hypothetical protein